MSERAVRNNRIIVVGALLVATILLGNLVHYVASQPAHPVPVNTIRHGVGMYFPAVDADDYFYRGYNVTAFFEAVAEWLENNTLPQPVWEPTVEWGLVYGTTGDWFNHTLPGEPVAVILQMHPLSLEIGAEFILPMVYDKTNTQWQLGLLWHNGTICTQDALVMYHMRWEQGLVDPNFPQFPAEPEGEPR